ncbi:addiction module protein [candidate division KSB1 bacterium]|nr:addiction module protein [candidate division KSB1 bacterium]
MIHTEIKKMSTLERLQTMEELWDSLCQEESDIESPKWHRTILEERRKEIEKGEAKFISLEELKSKV